MTNFFRFCTGADFSHRHSGKSRIRATMDYLGIVGSVAIAVTGCISGMRALGWFQNLELDTLDRAFQWRPPMEPDPRIVIVGIEEADIEQYGWPVTDGAIAKTLAAIQEQQPAVLGFDLYRNTIHPPGTAQLRSQLAYPNVVVIEKLGGNDAVPAPKGIPAMRIGFNNFLPDSDNVLRRHLMMVRLEGTTHYSLSLQVSRMYLDQQGYDFSVEPDGLRIGNTIFDDLEADSGGYQGLNTSGHQHLNRFHPDKIPAAYVSLGSVLKGDLDPNMMRDKIVFIGTVAPSIKDLFRTPHNHHARVSPVPGVVVHAHFSSHILRAVLDNEQMHWFLPNWTAQGWLLGWALLGGTIVWVVQKPMLLGSTGVAAIMALFGSGYVASWSAGWIPLWPALLTFTITGTVVFTYRTLYRLFYDGLTRLPQKTLFIKIINRSHYEARFLNMIGRSNGGDRVALLCIDLDGFKRVNESLGHDEGDRVLLEMTQRLKRSLPPQGKLAHFVSDKFAVWLRNLEREDEAIAIARTIQDTISIPLNIQQQEVVMSASIGIALGELGEQQANIPILDLIRNAQTAMHQAKARGKNQIEVFTDNMRLNIIAHFQTEADLRYAIERQELRTYYQPFVSLKTGQLAGFEALIRWQHPQHGLVPPGQFIPVAEDTDLIIPIGQWILHEACQQMQRWHIQFPAVSPLIISVNLSGRQFAQPELVMHIEQILNDTGLDGRFLKLELTESILMEDVDAVIETLRQMKQLNLKISIDDFGTGYSSLSYLHRFPINTLKIDRSFVMNLDEMGEDQAIVETIIALGHHLKMDVIAEGIETADQARKLRQLHCEYGQGYFFAKPMPADAVERFLRQPRFTIPSADSFAR